MSKFHGCKICNGQLDKIDAYSHLPRVTSDCKPWPSGGTLALCVNCGAIQKIPDAAWLDEIHRIYGDYQIYQLSGGSEQVIFLNKDEILPRSAALISFFLREVKLPDAGRLLDVGCGNGSALANFSKALPKWSLFGSELSDRNIERLRRIPNFVELFIGAPKTNMGQFDTISLIHSLEHMTDPLTVLAGNALLLSDGGKMLVQVPDLEASPFDLVVADHLLHFTRQTLACIVNRAGLVVDVIRNDVLPKEITLVAHRGAVSPAVPDAAFGANILRKNMDWLNDVLASARTAAKKVRSFGIFGTSISSMWLYGALSKQASFFVDEDESRIGGRIDEHPIFSIGDIPPGSTLYVPLIPPVAQRVRDKCGRSRHDCQIVIPPDISKL